MDQAQTDHVMENPIWEVSRIFTRVLLFENMTDILWFSLNLVFLVKPLLRIQRPDP